MEHYGDHLGDLSILCDFELDRIKGSSPALFYISLALIEQVIAVIFPSVATRRVYLCFRFEKL